jgi:8-oxo-dGTP diphosphatase
MNAIAVAIVIRDGKVLVQHRYRPGIGMIFEFPGGSVDDGENFAVAAARELQEETGISCCSHIATVESFGQDGRKLAFVILGCDSNQQPQMINPARRQTFYWLRPGEIPLDDFHAADRDFIDSRLQYYASRI